MTRLVLHLLKECSNTVLPAFRAALAAGLMAAVVVQIAAAGPVDDATAAYERGIIQPLANQGIATWQYMARATTGRH
jgi:hypothetical protein